MELNLEVIIICIVIFSMFIALIKEWLLPEFTVFLALSTLVLSGILSPSEALRGFSNPGVHTVALLFILGAAVSKSGILDELVNRILNSKKSVPLILLRLMLPVSTLSAFMNNTPIVTMLIPPLQKWGLSNNIKPSKLLIPLSYAAILGGTITLIGTSTNLIIQGLLLEKGSSGFRFFDFAYFGIPLSLAGVIYFIIIGHYLLPARNQHIEMFHEEHSKYIYKYSVENDSPLVGKSIVDAMLRNLNHMFLIQINRNGREIIPAPNDEIIQSEDILIFSGNPKGIKSISPFLGLKPLEEPFIKSISNHTTLFEVGISRNSTLLNKKIKESHFRSKYGAAIVSVKRKNQTITSGIGNMLLKAGDTLLLLAKKEFIKSWSDSEDFYFISPIEHEKTQQPYVKKVVVFLLLGVVLGSTFQLLPIFNLVLIATSVIVLSKILTVSDALKAINWNILILMGCAIGIGTAIETTGLAQILAVIFLNLQNEIGLIGILILFFAITMIMTEIVNNLATAAIMFPIGYSISVELSVDPLMFAMITAIAASCSFLSPIGYQTNLLVYGPGGYKFLDYLKVGIPLSLVCMTLTIIIAFFKWF